MKHLYLLLLLLVLKTTATAQLKAMASDTLLCRGQSLTLQASFQNFALGQPYPGPFGVGTLPGQSIGFSFVYFGESHTTFFMSTRNCIYLGNSFPPPQTGTTGVYSLDTNSSSSVNNYLKRTIMLGFQDLGNLNSPPRWQTFGSPGQRRFVVEFCSLEKLTSFYCQQFRVRNQAILYEGSNVIEVHTRSMPATPTCPENNYNNGGTRAIQGLRYVAPASGAVHEVFSPGRGPTDWWGNNNTDTAFTARRFTPVPGNPMAYTVDTIPYNPTHIILSVDSSAFSWHDATGALLGNGPSLTFVPQAPPLPADSTFVVLRYTGPAGCDTFSNLADTLVIRFGERLNHTEATICPGAAYSFLGRSLTQPGTYDSIFTAANGCDSIRRLVLSHDPPPAAAILAPDTAWGCSGRPFALRALLPPGATVDAWLKDGSPTGGASDTLWASQPGTYVLRVRSSLGCLHPADTVRLLFRPSPEVQIGPVQGPLCAGDTLRLEATAVASAQYHWRPEGLFPGSPTGNTAGAVLPFGTTTLRVTATDIWGCAGSDSLRVEAGNCCEVQLPNAFTPNGDGRNDQFEPKLGPGRVLLSFQIYDRWGRQVYRNGTTGRPWDGSDAKGKPLQGGVYMYTLQYRCPDGSTHRKNGEVTLMR